MGPLLLKPGSNRYEIATHQMQACLDAAGGCSTLEACLGIAVTQDAACQQGCDGERAITCRTNLRTSTNCGRFGGVCLAGACVDAPGSATPDGAVLCPANAIPTCGDTDTWDVCGEQSDTRVSCASRLAGSTCVDGACQLGNACVPGKFLDGLACEGRSLRVCVAGRLETVDCIALGFSGCDPFTRGCSPNPLLAP